MEIKIESQFVEVYVLILRTVFRSYNTGELFREKNKEEQFEGSPRE